MIEPVLKRIVIYNEPKKNSDDFVTAASADIGVDGSDGADYFYFRIMTPKKLLSILEEDKIMDGRATFIINNYDISLVEKEINKILKDCVRATWEECALAINQNLNWEYYNIQYETYEEALERLKDIDK